MKKFFSLLILAFFAFTACNIDEEITTELPPEIILDSQTGIYNIKVGRTIRIKPTFKNADNAEYRWTSGNDIISTDPYLEYTAEKSGNYFILLEVETEAGKAREEIRIDVVDLEIPTVSLAGSDKGYNILVEYELQLKPAVRETSLPTAYQWILDGNKVSTDLIYTFSSKETGDFNLRFEAENEDGSDFVEFQVKVLTEDQIPFSWTFPQNEYNISSGRYVIIKPDEIINGENAKYEWYVDNTLCEGENESHFIFKETAEGKHIVTAVAIIDQDGSPISLPKELTVNVLPPQGKYHRRKTSSSSAFWNKIYEYRPAPGQFINELKTGGFTGNETTEEAALKWAEERMKQERFVSLGGFGGYIIVGFDHSIDNSGDYDFAITGNSFIESSEPGVVWVMQDENGDGEPNDNWYELVGSETGKPTTIQDYAVTYYRPSGPKMPVQWTDNKGNSGEINYMKAFHNQDYYYPLWIEEDSYTLKGTCLEPRNYDKSGNGAHWINPPYDWGYADNYSSEDRLTDEENPGAGPNPNHFKISNAVYPDGNHVNLDYIDFIKVQSAVNAESGRLGELSTEVLNFYDYSINNK